MASFTSKDISDLLGINDKPSPFLKKLMYISEEEAHNIVPKFNFKESMNTEWKEIIDLANSGRLAGISRAFIDDNKLNLVSTSKDLYNSLLYQIYILDPRIVVIYDLRNGHRKVCPILPEKPNMNVRDIPLEPFDFSTLLPNKHNMSITFDKTELTKQNTLLKRHIRAITKALDDRKCNGIGIYSDRLYTITCKVDCVIFDFVYDTKVVSSKVWAYEDIIVDGNRIYIFGNAIAVLVDDKTLDILNSIKELEDLLKKERESALERINKLEKDITELNAFVGKK